MKRLGKLQESWLRAIAELRSGVWGPSFATIVSRNMDHSIKLCEALERLGMLDRTWVKIPSGPWRVESQAPQWSLTEKGKAYVAEHPRVTA